MTHNPIYKTVILALVFLALFDISYSQKKGIISDLDGYTTLRAGPGTQYEVIYEIEEGDDFVYTESEESDWWKVTRNDYEGYVHKSRIQPYYINDDENCNCIGYMVAGEKPVFKTEIDDITLVVCGYLDQRFDECSIKLSEFAIEDCTNKKHITFYGALRTCILNKMNNELEIVELTVLPVGKGMDWSEVPYSRTLITVENDSLKISDKEIILDLSVVTDSDIESFIQELPELKKINESYNSENIVGKLLVCSLKGNKKCLDIFNNLRDYLDYSLGAHPGHFYNECKYKLLEFSK